MAYEKRIYNKTIFLFAKNLKKAAATDLSAVLNTTQWSLIYSQENSIFWENRILV